MKKILKAFTLIELLVVIAIITLISSSGVFYFLDFVKEQEISQELNIIKDDIEKLNTEVNDYEIFDYEMIFETSNTGSYIVYKNFFDTEKQLLTINSSGSGIIQRINTGTGILKIYKENKLFKNIEIDRNQDFLFDFNKSRIYKMTGTFNLETINEIHLDYFSEDNIYPEKNNNLELIGINSKADKSGIENITKLRVINIGGNKKFFINSDVNQFVANKIYLFFEKVGKEQYMKIEK